MSTRRLLLIGLLAAVLASCTGAESTDGGRQSEGAGDQAPATPSAGASPLAAAGIDATVELTGPPTDGAGDVPTFSWGEVADAATYRLVVLDQGGGPIWAWEGTETSINLGGLPGERPVGEPGPVIESGSSWSVAALDADGHVVAVSVARPVSP